MLRNFTPSGSTLNFKAVFQAYTRWPQHSPAPARKATGTPAAMSCRKCAATQRQLVMLASLCLFVTERDVCVSAHNCGHIHHECNCAWSGDL